MSVPDDQPPWFGVCFLREVSVNGEPPDLFERTVWVVRAWSEEEAEARARQFCDGNEEPYLNKDGEIVTWSIVETVGVYSLLDDEIQDGTEVYSQLIRVEDASTGLPDP